MQETRPQIFMARSWEWFRARAESKAALAWLYVLSFSESCVFIIPPDFLLAAMLLAAGEGRTRWLALALHTTFASSLGALFGYFIGLLFFEALAEPLIRLWGLTESFAQVSNLFAQGTLWFMFTAAFTPIPFKVFVLAGGFVAAPIAPFMLGAIVGRLLRYLITAWLVARFGLPMWHLFLLHLHRFTYLAIALGVLAGLAWLMLR